MDFKNQKTTLDEIMAKIDEIQRESQVVENAQKMIDEYEYAQNEPIEETDKNVVDFGVFDQIKSDKNRLGIPEKKSAIRRLLDEEEDENEEGEEYNRKSYLYDDPPEDIEDFENQDERDEIYRDLKNIVGKMAVKAFFFLLLSVVSVYLFVAGFYPILFGGNSDSIFFDIALLAIDVLCISLSYSIFLQGLSRLIRAKADTDTMLALLAIALIVVRVTEMIKPEYISFSLVLEPFLAIGLYFNVQAKKKIAANIKNNFKLVSMQGDKLSVSIPSSCETINDLILETGEGGDTMFAHRTKLLSGYIDHSYSDFNWDERLYHFFFACILAIVVGTIAVSQLSGAAAAILFPAASLALSVPFFSRYFYSFSIFKNGKKIRKNGGVLTSAASAKELEDADLMIISEEDFLEDDSVLLQGVKAMGDTQIDDLITNIAALFNSVGTPLKPLFLKMIDLNSVSLPRVDDIYYHEGMGYSCLIHSKMFLVGNRKLMEQFNIDFPTELFELKLKDSRYPVYAAYHKSAAGIFIASFEQSKRTAEAIELIEKECVSMGIVSNDFLFNLDQLIKIYPKLQPNLFHFISTKTGAKCRDFLARKEKSSDLLASITGPKGLIACLYGSSKLLDALKINTIIRIIYPIISIALMLFIALAGYSANTALQIMAFQFIWFLPVWLVCTFCK